MEGRGDSKVRTPELTSKIELGAEEVAYWLRILAP